jgi:hypothetical protein
MDSWLQIRVELTSGHAQRTPKPPGRVFVCAPDHSFEEFAHAINVGFGRWDLAHLHVFNLAGGRRIGPVDGIVDELGFEDHRVLKPSAELSPSDRFEFVFDFGDDWRHDCVVLPEIFDPEEAWPGVELPVEVFAIDGWGSLPDQYGREREQSDTDEFE